MIIQTPELIEQKNQDARARIGKHILVGVSYPHGVVFGRTFNQRFHTPHRWSWQIADDDFYLIAAAIGDFGDFGVIKSGMNAHEQFLTDMVGSVHITCNGLAKNIRSLFIRTREEGIQNLAVDLVLYDVRKNMFWYLNDRGRVYTFSDFVVVGADAYQPTLDSRKIDPTAAAILSGSPHTEDSGAVRELITRIVKFADGLGKKAVIQYLAEKTTQHTYENRDSAFVALLVKDTLLQYDQPSQSEQFELVVMENRPEKSGAYFNTILELTEETRQKRALRFTVPDYVYQA